MKGYCTWLLLCISLYFAQAKSQRSVGNTCYPNEIPCDNSECISRDVWCDGKTDCRDRSDEEYCKTGGWFSSATDCNDEKHFQCGNGPCVPVSTKCDGFKNCKNGADEKNCDTAVKKEYDSEKIITVPAVNTKTDDVSDIDDFFDNVDDFDNDDVSDNNDFFDNSDAFKHVDDCEHDDYVSFPEDDNNIISTTFENVEATSSPNYVASVISVSNAPVDDYYGKRYIESLNDHSNFDYNKARDIHPRYNHEQQGSHSQISSNSRKEQTVTFNTNNQYDNIGNIRNSDETIVNLPPRLFPGTTQSSISDTYYPNNQHINKNEVRSGHGSAASITSSSRTFTPTVQWSISAPRGTVRSTESGETTIHLPPRVFFPIVQPSDTNYNSQYVNEKNVRSGYSSRASVASSSHTFPPTTPPYTSRTRGNKANVRSGPSDDTIVWLPPRIFFSTAQQSTSDTSRHGNPENARSWEQGRTLTSSADYAAIHLEPQVADHDNSAYGLQSDASSNTFDAPFHFKYNYTQKLGHHYKNNVQRAKDWILSQRNVSFGWGKDTPRALIALSLMTNTFSLKFTENELMKKSLATGFGIRMHLMREKDYPNRNTNILTNSTLATYINALLATCQDPQNFFSNDLTQELLHKTTFSGTDVNPLVYLTLCITNTPIQDPNAMDKLQRLLTMAYQDERSSDMQILATTALACFQRRNPRQRQLESIVKGAFNTLLERRLSDYSFGSKYSTALAAQALMSIDTNEWRDARKTLDFLANTQERDGSFGDMLATYLIVPALSGRSLLHLSNTKCDPVIPQPGTAKPSTEFEEGPGPKKNIYYTIKVGHPETHTITTSCLEIGEDQNFLFAMRKAQHFNSQFRFLNKTLDNGKTDVHTIIDIPNDTERGFRWRLFKGDAREGVRVDFKKPIEEDVAELIPKNYEEFVYWYLPMML